MAKRIGKRTVILENKPYIIGYGSGVGKKEFEGPLGQEFDANGDDSRFGKIEDLGVTDANNIGAVMALP